MCRKALPTTFQLTVEIWPVRTEDIVQHDVERSDHQLPIVVTVYGYNRTLWRLKPWGLCTGVDSSSTLHDMHYHSFMELHFHTHKTKILHMHGGPLHDSRESLLHHMHSRSSVCPAALLFSELCSVLTRNSSRAIRAQVRKLFHLLLSSSKSNAMGNLGK